MIAYQIVSGAGNSDYNSYQNSIVSYLTGNYLQTLAYFNGNFSTYDNKSRQVIERKGVYILSNVISSTNILNSSSTVSSVLSILEQLMQDYSYMIYEGEEQDAIRYLMLEILSAMDSQVSVFNGTTLSGFQTRMNNLYSKLLNSDLKGLSKGSISSSI